MGRKQYLLVYTATNAVNGKSYVGQTKTTLAARKSQHKTKALKLNAESPFYRAIREYGWDAFDWEVVGHCNSQKELDELETKTIEALSSNCYNSSSGGKSHFNISEAHKGIIRRNMMGKRNPMYGKKLSEEEKHNLLKASMEVCCKQVQNIETGKVYESVSECARQEGCSIATVSMHCNRKIKSQRYQFL